MVKQLNLFFNRVYNSNEAQKYHDFGCLPWQTDDAIHPAPCWQISNNICDISIS